MWDECALAMLAPLLLGIWDNQSDFEYWPLSFSFLSFFLSLSYSIASVSSFLLLVLLIFSSSFFSSHLSFAWRNEIDRIHCFKDLRST